MKDDLENDNDPAVQYLGTSGCRRVLTDVWPLDGVYGRRRTGEFGAEMMTGSVSIWSGGYVGMERLIVGMRNPSRSVSSNASSSADDDELIETPTSTR